MGRPLQSLGLGRVLRRVARTQFAPRDSGVSSVLEARRLSLIASTIVKLPHGLLDDAVLLVEFTLLLLVIGKAPHIGQVDAKADRNEKQWARIHRRLLLPLFEPSSKVLWKIGALLEAFDSFLDVVIQSFEVNLRIVQDHIRCAVVSVTGLAYRTHVHDNLVCLFGVGKFRLEARRLVKTVGVLAVGLREHTRIVRVTREAYFPVHVFRRGKNFFHFAFVLPVLIENVLASRVSRRTVDEEKVVLDVTTLQTPEKVPQVAVDFKRL